MSNNIHIYIILKLLTIGSQCITGLVNIRQTAEKKLLARHNNRAAAKKEL